MPDSPAGFILLLVVGVAVGFVAGMFGVGGGFLLTPILLYGFHVPAMVAVASSLCQQIGTSLAAFLRYRHLRRGEPRLDLIMMGGSLLGVDAGGRLLAALSRGGATVAINGRAVDLVPLLLGGLFFVMLAGIALFVGVEAVRAHPTASEPGPLTRLVRLPPFVDLPGAGLGARVSVPLLASLGFLLGVLSGVMGVGGGVLLLPLLIYGVGMRAKDAAGTGILLLFVTVLWGTAGAAWRGDVSLPLSLTLLVGASLGAPIGATFTNRLPDPTLKRIFAVLVAVAAVSVLLGTLRRMLIG